MFTITLFLIGIALLVMGLMWTIGKPVEFFKLNIDVKKDSNGFPEYIDFHFEYVGSKWFLFGAVFMIGSALAGLFQV